MGRPGMQDIVPGPRPSADRPLVSIVAPFCNEQAALSELLGRIVTTVSALTDRYDFEFVFVDDGSRDDSLAIARRLAASEPRLRVVELRRNYGQTAALQAGLDACEGSIIISMDADLQHFPEEIPRFLEKIEGGADVVCGWRQWRREGVLRRWPSRVANLFLRRISRLPVHDFGTTYRAYRREIVHDLRLLGEHHRFVPVLAGAVGARVDEIAIQNIERPYGRSNYGLGRTLNVLVDLAFLYFLIRYVDRPIRIFGRISLAAFCAGSVIAAVLLADWAATGRPVVRERSGWFMLSAFLMLTSVQVLLTGVLAELLTRVYHKHSEQSSYQVRRTWSAGEN